MYTKYTTLSKELIVMRRDFGAEGLVGEPDGNLISVHANVVF